MADEANDLDLCPWQLSISRQTDGSLYLYLEHSGGKVGLVLTDEERRELLKIAGDPEGAGYYRTTRRERP